VLDDHTFADLASSSIVSKGGVTGNWHNMPHAK
jgi:hypothetical protein